MSGDSEPATTAAEPLEPAPAPKPKRSWLARALDTAAVLVVLYAVFHFFIAPRFAPQTALQAAPPLTLATVDGAEFSLASHRGHVVFLDFWASWCEPCQQSLPLVEHFAKTHPDIDVIPVDSGEARAAASQYAQAHDMQHVALDPDTAATHAYGVGGLPTMYVIDPDGNVRAKWIGFNPAVEEEMADARVRYAKPKHTSFTQGPVRAGEHTASLGTTIFSLLGKNSLAKNLTAFQAPSNLFDGPATRCALPPGPTICAACIAWN